MICGLILFFYAKHRLSKPVKSINYDLVHVALCDVRHN